MPIKRYLLFAYLIYYPSGGWHDFRGSFDSVKEAEDNVPEGIDRYHIVDTHTGEVTY
jgi:hypothetical protein